MVNKIYSALALEQLALCGGDCGMFVEVAVIYIDR